MNQTLRPNLDTWFLALARVVAQRSTCLRRAVGAILVNDSGHILSTGYNGVVAGAAHCNDRGEVLSSGDGSCGPNSAFSYAVHAYPFACPGANALSGTELDACQAVHAEQNALMQCDHVEWIKVCYVTCAPCVTCVKMLLNTGCLRVVFAEGYAHQLAAEKLWLAARGAGTWQLGAAG